MHKAHFICQFLFWAVSECCSVNYGRCVLQCGQAVSDMEVMCYGQPCALRCIYYTEGAVFWVTDHMKCALVQSKRSED